jgi:hypothetical protein
LVPLSGPIPTEPQTGIDSNLHAIVMAQTGPNFDFMACTHPKNGS